LLIDENNSKRPPKVFHPPSASNARAQIRGQNDRMMYQNPFGFSKYVELDEMHQQHKKVLFGDFIPASAKPLRGLAKRQ